MRSVSGFEANLLRILHCLMRRAPLAQAWPLLLRQHDVPPCLGRDAVELVQEALAKGCVSLLAEQGGWHRGRFLRAGRVVEGRLWDRSAPEDLGLEFSQASLEFLIWLTATALGDAPEPKRSRHRTFTLGDGVLAFFAYEALRGTELAKVVRTRLMVRRNGLCWLAYPEDFADNSPGVGPDWGPWGEGVGPCIVEAMQPRLAERWLQVERGKRGITAPTTMRNLGEAQGRILDAFLDQVDAAGRRDLSRFLLDVAAALLSPDATERLWVERLDLGRLRLADRFATYRAALALLHRLDRLRRWDLEARGVGYFDEGYAASQLWKAAWDDRDGEALWTRSRAIIRRLEPMGAGLDETTPRD